MRSRRAGGARASWPDPDSESSLSDTGRLRNDFLRVATLNGVKYPSGYDKVDEPLEAHGVCS
jgi:hypothetical protein